jgi:hypothetical protein
MHKKGISLKVSELEGYKRELLQLKRIMEEHPAVEYTLAGVVAYALLEHAYRLLLFRSKSYYPLEPIPLLIGFLVELAVVYYFGKKLLKNET